MVLSSTVLVENCTVPSCLVMFLYRFVWFGFVKAGKSGLEQCAVIVMYSILNCSKGAIWYREKKIFLRTYMIIMVGEQIHASNPDH
jgi:hypothetical protein